MRKVFIALLCAIPLACTVGCKTCEPEIIVEPQIVEVPVPVKGEPLKLPAPPILERCGDLPVREKIQCIGTNIKRIERYSDELRIEIESHNDSLGGADG